MDYLCSDCLAENPVLEDLMKESWLDGTVADQIALAITPFPLPYHVHSYQVAQLVPYFMQLCVESNSATCLDSEYRDLAFANLETILGMKDTSTNDFITWWSTTVETALGLPAGSVADSYSSSTYNTDSNTRTLLKYGWSKGVFGTPMAFVNGVMLDTVPSSVGEWMVLLKKTYLSQFKAPSA